MIRRLLRPLPWFPLLLAGAVAPPATFPSEKLPAWTRVSSDHFSVVSDAGEEKGREIVIRLEQMRVAAGDLLMKNKLKLAEPLEILALRSESEYAQVAPLAGGRIPWGGFFLPGSDRNYMVFDASATDNWRSITHQFAHLCLRYNYPPTQAWFEEGFAEYFSSIRLNNQGATLGSDPHSLAAPRPEGEKSGDEAGSSLIGVLGSTPWLPWPDLFHHEVPSANEEKAHRSLFSAQSWIVVHYLISKGMLPQTGEYFDLVENQKVATERAFSQAFGTTVSQFDQDLRGYFRSLETFEERRQGTKTSSKPGVEHSYQLALAIEASNLGASARQVPSPAAQALLEEMAIRVPEHSAAALQQLSQLAGNPKTETSIAHRALAWNRMQHDQSAEAIEELNQGMAIDDRDPWVRYDLALVGHLANQSGGRPASGLSNIMQDLQIVIDWYPDFAEAYNMLAMARLAGGGNHAARSAIDEAIRLDPRRPAYVLNLAEIAMAEKQWDFATMQLNRLRNGPDPQVASAAAKDLNDLPSLRKYGIRPQSEAAAAGPSASAPAPPPPAEDAGQAAASATPPSSAPDLRPVKFLKGVLVRVDCAGSSATLLVSSGDRTLKLRTENYKSVLMLGSDEFSCQWKNRAANVNYKAGGKAEGDLVSVELR